MAVRIALGRRRRMNDSTSTFRIATIAIRAVAAIAFANLLVLPQEAAAQCSGWPVHCKGISPSSPSTGGSVEDDGAPCRNGWFHGPVWNAILGPCPAAGSVSSNTSGGNTPSQMPKTYNPSFQCKLATIATEVTICVNPGLSALDRQMSAGYWQLYKTLDEMDQLSLKDEQGNWKSSRDECGSNVACISSAYSKRVAQLGMGGKCLICGEAFKAAIATGIGTTADPRNFVIQRRASYANCVQKLPGRCQNTAGDTLYQSLAQTCEKDINNADEYKRCIDAVAVEPRW